MKIQIRTFGRVTEIVGKTHWEHQEASNLDSLKIQLEKAYPELKEINYFFSVDRKLVRGNIELQPNCEVALMPPFSGG